MKIVNYLLFFLLILFIFLFFFVDFNFSFLKKELNINEQLLKKENFLNQELELKTDKFERENIIENKINTLPPLIYNLVKIKKEGFLTKEGIINFTNKIRLENNLPPLKENEKLNQMAELKIKDMFENQYFSHQLANQKDISYLAEQVNYQYIKLGENLAKGYFENDEELVLAWFNSPGHRANILNSKYQEIGVAVKKVFFQGELLYLAVQHFGTSLDYCPKDFEDLKEKIDLKKSELEQMNLILNERKNYIENYQKNLELKEIESLQKMITDYNSLVEFYNSSLFEVKDLINKYNQKIEEFNNCLKQYQ